MKPDGITHHKAGDKLPPGKCAKLSFVVKHEGFTSPLTWVELKFYVNDGGTDMTFSGVRHSTQTAHVKHPSGLYMHVSGGGEHSTIHIDKK